ncbi:unnamed protein product, partial [Penicillium discolor]
MYQNYIRGVHAVTAFQYRCAPSPAHLSGIGYLFTDARIPTGARTATTYRRSHTRTEEGNTVSADTLTIIVSAIGVVLTLGASLFAAGAWMIRRIDERLGAVDHRLSTGIGSVEEKLGARIDTVEEKLTARIDTVEEKLGARIDT